MWLHRLLCLSLLCCCTGASVAQTSDTSEVCLKMTSKVSGAEIKVKRLVVVEEKDGAIVDEYLIDLDDGKVYLGKEHASTNDLHVEGLSAKEGAAETKFTEEPMKCGATIKKPCGFIELPDNYKAGVDCKWIIAMGIPMEYTTEELEVIPMQNHHF